MSEQKQKDDVLASCLLVLVGLPVAIMSDAFVIWKGWHWFVVPTFGARTLPLAVIVGLRQLYAVASYRRSGKDDRKYGDLLAISLGIDAIALLVMWVARTVGAA